MDETADNSIGNVTGSNSVNVFLGLGLPWSLAAIYWSATQILQINCKFCKFLAGSFSAVSKGNFARKYAFD